jgi:prepilin-type N-terminal cleavage/methylation domain-containing protein
MTSFISRSRSVAPRARAVRGFSLVELLIVVALFTIAGAIAVPAITNMLGGMRVGAAAREVERELQTARLRAVSSNRPILVRFNCPSASQFRMVELIGTPGSPATDDDDARAATRCGMSAYPYPDPNRGVFDIPNNDGPLKQLDSRVRFTAVQTIEFWPDGTAHTNLGGDPWPPIATNAPVSISLQLSSGSSASQAATAKTVRVNGSGQIQLQ